MKYTDQQLHSMNVRDLINDYRSTVADLQSGEAAKFHDGYQLARLAEYAEQCKQRAIALFKARHRATIGQFGQSII